MQDLIRLLPDGASAVAVIIVVMLFLKQQDKIGITLESMTKGFHDQTAESRRSFQEQVLNLTAQQYENQKLYQDQIQTLIDAHLKVSREMITALKALESAVDEATGHGTHRIPPA